MIVIKGGITLKVEGWMSEEDWSPNTIYPLVEEACAKGWHTFRAEVNDRDTIVFYSGPEATTEELAKLWADWEAD